MRKRGSCSLCKATDNECVITVQMEDKFNGFSSILIIEHTSSVFTNRKKTAISVNHKESSIFFPRIRFWYGDHAHQIPVRIIRNCKSY